MVVILSFSCLLFTWAKFSLDPLVKRDLIFLYHMKLHCHNCINFWCYLVLNYWQGSEVESSASETRQLWLHRGSACSWITSLYTTITFIANNFGFLHFLNYHEYNHHLHLHANWDYHIPHSCYTIRQNFSMVGEAKAISFWGVVWNYCLSELWKWFSTWHFIPYEGKEWNSIKRFGFISP